MARRLNFKQEIWQGYDRVDLYTDLVTYLGGDVLDDVGLIDTTLVIPAASVYTAYEMNLREDAVFTYFFDVDVDPGVGAVIKLNGDTTEFNIKPDFWTEESIETVLIKNTFGSDRIIRVLQGYPRAISIT